MKSYQLRQQQLKNSFTMKLTNKNLLYLAAFALIGYLIYRQYKSMVKNIAKEKEGEQINGPAPVNAATGVKVSSWGTYDPETNFDLNLKKGMYNGSVKYAQQLMNKYLPYQGVPELDPVDGKFGTDTENAMAALYGTRQATLRYLINNTKLIV